MLAELERNYYGCWDIPNVNGPISTYDPRNSNHTQFRPPTGNMNPSNFGRSLSAASGRIVQLAAKIHF